MGHGAGAVHDHTPGRPPARHLPLPCRSASWRRLALPQLRCVMAALSAHLPTLLHFHGPHKPRYARASQARERRPRREQRGSAAMRLAAAALAPARPVAALARPICSSTPNGGGGRRRHLARRAVAPSKRSEPLQDSTAALERLYLSAAAEVDAAARPPLAPAPAAAAGTQHQLQQLQQQVEQPPGSPTHHRLKQLEVCGHSGAGLHVCVEHTIDEDTGAELPAEPAVPLTGPAAWLAQLMDKIPLSKRTRGIIMLNLLVLLVATNWVRTATSGCCRVWSWAVDSGHRWAGPFARTAALPTRPVARTLDLCGCGVLRLR